MAEFEVKPQPLQLSDPKTNNVLTSDSFRDLDFFQLGTGIESIIFDIQTGFYLGGENFLTAPFSVSMAGKVRATDYELIGGSITNAVLTGLATGSDINIQGWSSDLSIQATDYRTVTWTAGTIKLADGTVFNIATGNTGNMAALTYIYFDKAVSTTVLQKTTVATDAVGANKILVAVAKNNSDVLSKATFQAFGGAGGVLLTVDNIAANSASVNEFISNTAQIKDAVITAAKIGSLNADVINAGTIVGRTIKAKGGTTNDVWINSTSGDLEFYYNEVKKAGIGVDSSFNLIYQAATSHQFFDNGGAQLAVFKDSATQNLQLIKGGISMSTAGSEISWSSGRKITDGGDEIQVNGFFRCTAYRLRDGGSTYYGADSTNLKIVTDTYWVNSDQSIRIKYRNIDIRKGIITDVPSESSETVIDKVWNG